MFFLGFDETPINATWAGLKSAVDSIEPEPVVVILLHSYGRREIVFFKELLTISLNEVFKRSFHRSFLTQKTSTVCGLSFLLCLFVELVRFVRLMAFVVRPHPTTHNASTVSRDTSSVNLRVPKQHPNNTQTTPNQHPNNTQTTPKQHPNTISNHPPSHVNPDCPAELVGLARLPLLCAQ